MGALALTTFVLSAHNAGWAPDVVWIGLAIFYGGLAQLLAGMCKLGTGGLEPPRHPVTVEIAGSSPAVRASEVVTSPGLHLTIGAFSNLNPSGVLPYTLGAPLAVLAIIVLMILLRRRRVDAGGPEEESEAPA